MRDTEWRYCYECKHELYGRCCHEGNIREDQRVSVGYPEGHFMNDGCRPSDMVELKKELT